MYVAELLLLVCCIEVDEIAVFVLLCTLDESLVFVEGEIFAVHVFHQGKLFCLVVERLLAEHAIVDKELQVVPLLLILLTVFLEDGLQTVGHFLGNIGGNLLYLTVAL